MKALSKIALVGAFLVLYTESMAALPGNKRTILTSGEKVYTIRYQLGQSTVLFFGIRPETVICGNKNYFNIEKIKDGITIQPLANFSTNLTVMAQGRRYLFYLTPSANLNPDGFVEVRWIPSNQLREVKPLAKEGLAIHREISQKARLMDFFEVSILRELSLEGGKRRIFEIELKNLNKNTITTNNVEIVAAIGGRPIERQVLAWESEDVKANSATKGRVIATVNESQSLNFVIGYLGKSTKILLKGGRH